MTAPSLEEMAANIKDVRARIVNVERKIDLVLQNNIKLDSNILDSVMDTRDQSYGSRIYSQNGDEIIVLNIFRALGQKKGTYLDIGANDPINISNTALLYQRGWRGLNVEPNPNFVQAYKVQRPEDINLNVGVAAEAGTLTYYMFAERSGLNTFSKDQAELITRDAGLPVLRTMEIPVVTVGQIVTEHLKNIFPDVLFVDVEGMDLDILKSIDMSQGSPKLICVEANTSKQKFGIVKYLEDIDYTLTFVAGANLFFLKRELFSKIRE